MKQFTRFSASCCLRNAVSLRGNPNGFPLVAAFLVARILLECRNYTLSVRQGIAKWSEKGKSVVLPFSRNYQNSDFPCARDYYKIYPNSSRKIAAKRDFREQKQLFAKAKTTLFAFAPNKPKGIRGKSECGDSKIREP